LTRIHIFLIIWKTYIFSERKRPLIKGTAVLEFIKDFILFQIISYIGDALNIVRPEFTIVGYFLCEDRYVPVKKMAENPLFCTELSD
jgi:hypothetical protein